MLCLRRIESSKFTIKVLNVATVDVPGVIISLQRGPCKHGLYLFGHNNCLLWSSNGLIIHIGVGSDVVCSTLMGSARASMRGTDNRRFHAFFVSIDNNALLGFGKIITVRQ